MGKQQTMTTWDGKPISQEKPHGASIIVYRQIEHSYEFLILHRAHNGMDYAGEWAWTPPAGARYPGESLFECAQRELKEETGLRLSIKQTQHGSQDWAIYVAEAGVLDEVQLDEEHDRFEWVPIKIAVDRCLPEQVSNSLCAVGAELALL